MKWQHILLAFTFLLPSFLSAQEEKDDFYDVSSIRNIQVTLSESNWVDALDSMKLYGEEMLIGTVKIDGTTYKNVGIRYRGSKSFNIGGERNPYLIKLNHIHKDQNHQGYTSIKLSSALRDPSMVREVLSYEIARQYMPAPKANYARLTVNGAYRGIFVNVESVSDKFLKDNFGSSQNVFFKAASPGRKMKAHKGCRNGTYGSLQYEENIQCYFSNFELKSESGWDELIKLTETLNNNTSEIGKILDVDNTLWMLAFNNVLVNLSSYSGANSQNFYLYQDNHGRFVPILWDLNLSFGSYKNIKAGASSLSLKDLQTLDPLVHSDNPNKPLIQKLLANPTLKNVYLAHIRTILNDHFLNGNYEKRAKELQRKISNDMFSDKYKFYEHSEFLSSLNKTIGQRSKIPGIVELMSKRARFLKKHATLRSFPPEVSDVLVQTKDKFANKELNTYHIQAKADKKARKVRIYYRFKANDVFEMLTMKDDGKNNDGQAGDKIFGVAIDSKGNTDIEYYIVAENAGGITFSPSSYTSEPHRSSLEAINE